MTLAMILLLTILAVVTSALPQIENEKPSEEEYETLALLAEQCERYEDMAKTMHTMATERILLSDRQRNLLSVAYKHVAGQMRSSWRIVSSIEQKCKEAGNELKVSWAKKYREKIASEFKDCCNELISLVNDVLLPNVDSVHVHVEAKVFYTKVMGDYYCYMYEVANAEKRPALVEKAREAYDGAAVVAEGLSSTNPIKLGLALNRSVFYYEIEKDSKKARELAKTAFYNAIAELDNLKEDTYNDSTSIMQLLRDKLTLWTSDQDDEN